MSNLPEVVTLDSSDDDIVCLSNFLTPKPIVELLSNPTLPSFAPIAHWINNDFDEEGQIVLVNVSSSSSSSSSLGVWNTSSSSLDSSSSSRIVFDTEHSADSNDNQLNPNIVITYATSDSDNNNVRSHQDTAMQDLDLHSSPSRDWFDTSDEEIEQ